MPGEYPAIEETLAGPVVDLIRSTWIFLAQPHSATGAYIQALQNADAAEYPYRGDTLSASVVNRAPYASVIEHGHQGFHLPERILFWRHHNRRGRGYTVVPFRHFAPGTTSSTGRAMRGALPQDIYERARRLGADRLRELGDLYKQSKSYRYMIGANRVWHAPVSHGLRHARHMAIQATGHPIYTWKSSPYEGLQRDAHITEHANQGVYTTFRTITEDSPGWYIPGQRGLFLAQQTAEQVGPLIRPLIVQAAQRDAVRAFTDVFAGAGFQVEVD